MEVLSEILRNLRKKKGISQAELAEHLHIVQQTVAKWETDTATPGVSTIKDLALYFGVSVDYLLEMPKQVSADEKEEDPLSDFPKNVRAHMGKYCALSHNSRRVVDATLEVLWNIEFADKRFQ